MRDRDAQGRARSARPRDASGRPLPRGAPGVEQLPEELELEPTEALDLAQRLLDDGRPFAAHEVLEAAWKAAPDGERELWRGLAQLAVGLTHLQRGNARGAVALLERAAERLSTRAAERLGTRAAERLSTRAAERLGTQAAEGPGGRAGEEPAGRTGDAPHGLDIDGLRTHATALAARITGVGAEAVTEDERRPRLRR